MKKLKKLMYLILIIALITTSLNIMSFVIAETNNKDILYYTQRLSNKEDWEVIRNEIGLPYGVRRFNYAGFEFNFRLWFDKQITVYGTYENIQDNDFKQGTQSSSGEAYYILKGKAGEYRYHGFTAEGSKYTNINYVNDMDSKRKAYEKKWIIEPWENSKTKPYISEYNRTAIYSIDLDEQSQVQNWLKTDFPEFYTTEGIKATDHYNYFNVETPSGLINYGEAVGYHRTSNGREWYQTFSLPKATTKVATPVKASIEIMDLNYNLYNNSRPISFKGMSSVDILVKVTSTLEDKDYYKDYETRTMHFSRLDINFPIFKLANLQGIFKDIPVKNKPNNIDTTVENFSSVVYYKFTLEDNQQNRQNNILTFSANTSFLYFGNAGESQLASATAVAPIDWQDPIQSDFNINKNINKLQGEYISLEDISYKDASFGQIDNYIYTIEDMQDLTHINDEYFTTTVLDEERVNNEIKELLNKYIGEIGIYSFNIIQQVYNQATDMYILSEKTITLTIGEEIIPVIPDVRMPRDVLDIVPMKASEAYDNTPTESYKSRIITVDGIVKDNFFNNYVWGDEADGLHKVEIKYISNEDLESEYTAWILVHDTKPQAQFDMVGTFKENRLLSVQNTSYYVDSYVSELSNHYEYKDKLKIDIEYYNYESQFLETDVNTQNFMYKQKGFYQYNLKANTELRRSKGMEDIEYNFNFEIQEDNTPAVTFNIWNSVLARNEDLMISFSAESVDEDYISIEKFDLYYDESNDQSYTYNEGEYTLEQLQNFKPTKLGSYKVEAFVKEDFGQSTILNKITDTDYKTTELIRYFYVDNYRPSTTLSVDIPMTLPKVDVFVLTDESLNNTKTSSIKAESVNNNNYLRKSNLIPTYNIWDLHTYTYSSNVSKSKTTGTRYPSSTMSYNSNGYSGTLRRTSVSDNGRYVDYGRNENKTESKTATDTHMGSSYAKWNKDGKLVKSTSSNTPSISYSDSAGYRGTLSKTGASLADEKWTYFSDGSKEVKRKWLGRYSGTVSRTVTVWVSDYKWVSNYRGYYSGTVYRSEKQDYYSPFRVDAKRYVIYVTEGSISSTSNINAVVNNNDVSIILIGSNTARSQIVHEHFMLNNSEDINSLINQAMDWIIQQNPLDTEQFTVLSPFNFDMKCGNYDEEEDTITKEEYLYVHNPEYYDNPTESEVDSVRNYNTELGWTSIVKNSFSKAGAYTVYRRIIDEATQDPRFISYNKQSNEPYFQVHIHRKPIAIADMKWKYDISSSLYKLTFIEKSFDLDHEYSREDKGIEETMIRYKAVGSIEWNYKIPTDLTAGSYTIEYYVKDIEQVWSQPYILDVTLDTVPIASITIESEIQYKEAIFRNENTIPAGETIQIVSPNKTTGAVIHSNIPIVSAEVYVNGAKYSNLTLQQQTSDIEYLYYVNVLEYNIPQDFEDGKFYISIRANSNVNNQYEDKKHEVDVYTPIWEDYGTGNLRNIEEALSQIPTSILLSESIEFEQINKFSIVSSKYTDKLKVNAEGIIYYLFSNENISINENGTGQEKEIKIIAGDNKYKISNLNIIEDSYKKYWDFDISIVEGYPILNEDEFSISITGYDKGGNWSTANYKHNSNPQVKTVKADCYLLESFRIVLVRDLHLENYYLDKGTGMYLDKSIFVDAMAVDGKSFNNGTIISSLTKGYMFEFEINSINFNAQTDTIIIEPNFYTCDSFVRDEAERDIYWKDSSGTIHKIGQGAHFEYNSITLNNQNRIILDDNISKWRGNYFIPATSWAVPKGTLMENAKNSDLKRDIIVNFTIRGYKNGELKFDYNTEQWEKERISEKYPYKIGDVIRYDWRKSCLDDYKVIRNR